MTSNIERIVTEKLAKLGITITDEKVRRDLNRLAEEAIANVADKALKPKLLTKLLASALSSKRTASPNRQPSA